MRSKVQWDLGFFIPKNPLREELQDESTTVARNFEMNKSSYLWFKIERICNVEIFNEYTRTIDNS